MPGTDDGRFKTLIEPHLEALYRTAYRLSRNRADAEDLVQETCVTACTRIETIRESDNAKAWLMRVLHNLFVDGTRRAGRSPIDGHGDGSDPAATAVSTGPTPEESLASTQREAELERAWLRLDRGHRALLALRAEGHSLAEISKITDIAMDALTMRLYRARQSLTRHLREAQSPASVIPMEASK